MKASEIVKELQSIIENEGDLDVDVSVAKQPEITDQQYLVADARFVIVEPYEKGTRISIRDWPY
ncbi:hypothetical protein LCGC14_1741950 [marine sediment metagenome]|uniref:Uncharacterized protein n=1 Tax=marine sediment metagenome TaxID=412755 RepID=A0A0F9HU06_9ZZZZ